MLVDLSNRRLFYHRDPQAFLHAFPDARMGATVEPRGSTSNTISPFLSLTLPLFSPHLLSSPAVYNSVAAKYLTPSVYFERSPWHGPTVFRKRRERMREATKGLVGRATCVDDRRWNACWNCTCQEFVPTSARTRFVSSITVLFAYSSCFHVQNHFCQQIST